MSRSAKICFLLAFLLLVASYVMQIITGLWVNLNSILMGLAAALVVLAMVLDWKLYFEFFTMRTTKHGMNMGAMIVLVLTMVFCVNYLANKHNKTLDLTREKINSLSDQTTKVLAGLKQDLEIKVFYKGQAKAVEDKKAELKKSLNLYKDASGKLKVSFINGYVEQDKAMQYLAGQPDRDVAPVVAFVEYGNKRIRVDEPFDEATLTAAMIKATREGDTKVYFLKGHGEKDITGEDDQGLREFARSLEEASFKVDSLALVDSKQIPADASVVAIVGPSAPYLDAELQWLREFAAKGGRIFVAADPGQRHNLANLMKPLGIEFQNNYVVTPFPQLVGQGAATVLGRTFDPSSEITRSIPAGAGFAIFPLASEVRPAPDKPAGVDVREIVKTDKTTFTVADLTRPPQGQPQLQPVTVAVSATGAVAKAEGKKDEKAAETKPFELVVFGDSDFLSNRALMAGVNRDLAMNAFAQLANQKDLLSIRPKIAKGNLIVLTQIQKYGAAMGGIAIPLLLMASSLVLWFRRRGA